MEIHARANSTIGGGNARAVVGVIGQLLRGGSRAGLPEIVAADTTFGQLVPMLLEYFEVYHAETTLKGERGRLDRITARFGDLSLSKIRSADIQEFLMRFRAERHVCTGQKIVKNPPASPGTRNRYASTLSVAFRLAIEKGFVGTNPVQRIRRQREAKHPVPFISFADVARLLAPAHDLRFHALLRGLADTGLRSSEAVRLEWRDVDFDRGVLLVRVAPPVAVPLDLRADRCEPMLPTLVVIGLGFRAEKLGDAEVMIAGGVEGFWDLEIVRI